MTSTAASDASDAKRRPTTPASHRRNVRNLGIVTFISCGGLVMKAAQDLVLAYVMGAGPDVDVYGIVIALTMPAVTVLIAPAVVSFVPGYVLALERGGREAGNLLLSTVLPVAAVATCALTAALEAAAPALLHLVMRGNFSVAEFELGVGLLRVSFLLVPLRVGTRLAAAVLNAEHEFAIPTATGIIPPLLGTACLVGLSRSFGIYALPIGLVLGEFVQLVPLVWLMLKRTGRIPFRGLHLSPEIRAIASQYVPILIGSSISIMNPLIDRTIAGGLGAGSISHLFYGQKLISAGLEVASFAVSTVLLPLFSRLVAVDDWAGLRRTLILYSALIGAASLPVILGFQIFAPDFVRLTLQHGSFSASDTTVVAAVMRCLAFQIPFYVAGMLAARAVAALRMTYLLTIGAVVNATLNVGTDLLFVKIWGLPGIALSTAVVYGWSYTYLTACCLFVIRRKLKRDRQAKEAASPDPAERAESLST